MTAGRPRSCSASSSRRLAASVSARCDVAQTPTHEPRAKVALMSARLKLACLLVLPAWLPVATIRPAGAQTAAMAAVVNGDVVTQADVENRARFFALATGQRV